MVEEMNQQPSVKLEGTKVPSTEYHSSDDKNATNKPDYHYQRNGYHRGGYQGNNGYNSGDRFNNFNNGSQYARYNGNYMSRGYASGYKVHRNDMAPVIPMQWSGYPMGQPMYYMPEDIGMQMVQGSMDPVSSGSSSFSSSVSGSVPVAAKKIQITTKTGEQLDSSSIRSKHNSESASKEDSLNEKSVEAKVLTSEETDAEKTKRLFLEQIKLRKEALEKKKIGGKLPVEPEKEEKPGTDEKSKTEEEPNTENHQEEEPTEETVNTLPFIELTKMKKAQEQAESSEKVPCTETNGEPASKIGFNENEEEIIEVADETITVTELLNILNDAKPIEDIYSFKYPTGLEQPDARYKKEHIKYTYGPSFLLQFKDKIQVKADAKWIQDTVSRIVIPQGMARTDRPKDDRFGHGGRMGSNRNFSKGGSMRGIDGRNDSKRKSRRNGDDKKSIRGYTSRKDRERAAEGRVKDDHPREDVPPLVPSANRWVPKSKQQKTEKKFAPDGVTELLEKDDVQRKMKALLNKLTLEKFDTISTEILDIANLSKWETKSETLKAVIEELFHKACDEPHWSSMYAQLCGKLVKDLDPEISDEENEGKSGPKLVLHYLVARCHTEFEKGWSDKLPTNPDGTPLEVELMSEEYYQAASAKRRGLGLVRFIGHLYRLNLLSGKMMFECFRRLMRDLTGIPSEEILESVIELLSTVGEQFETDSFSAGQATLEGSVLLDSLFEMLQIVINSGNILSRIKFKLIEMKEVREKGWDGKKKDEGPKTISQIHEEDERQRRLKEMKNASRTNSRRANTSNYGGGNTNRNNSRRDQPRASREDFTSTRSSSNRINQRNQIKEESSHQSATANMFSALMNNEDDE